MKSTQTFDIRAAIMAASLAVSVLMLVGKLGAYFLTGSAAILSDAAESVIHGIATGIAALSMWYTRRPASRTHPYGFGKLAYFSAGFEGSLILSAALFIYYEAIRSLIAGPELKQLDWGLLITGGLAAINLVLGLSLVAVGKRHNDLILVANGKHVLTDMWTSALVVIGVFIVWLTDILWLDPATAIFAASNIVWSAVGLMRRSFSGLLDEADPAHSAQIIEALNAAKRDGLIHDHHQLRLRHSHQNIWVELHMLMPGTLPVSDAHTAVTRVEKSIQELFPQFQVHVTTHIEPSAHASAHPEGHGGMRAPYDEVKNG
jgi:cation diffusion facilitator family transporter